MIRQQSIGWMTLVLISLVGTYVMGQDESAAELYGRGLHAYFAGDYDAAVDLLSSSIDKNNSDPRAYYFRGLALANKFGMASGLEDFTKGADVEVNQADRPVYDINGALQRVQGSLRLELEKVRAATRKAAVDRQKKRDKVRYEELKRREDIVLFDPQRPAPPVKVDVPAPDLGDKPDPFASGLAFSGGKQVNYVPPTPVEPGAAPAAPGDASQARDPFAAPSAEAPAEPAAEPADPFATPTTKPAPAAVETNKTPPADANPFGDNMPTLEMQGVERPAPSMGIGDGLINLFGKTLSGQTGNRDPFGAPGAKEPVQGGEPEKKADPTPPADAPSVDPFDTPGKVPVPGDEPENKSGAKPSAGAPAGNAAPPADTSKKPAQQSEDPFK